MTIRTQDGAGVRKVQSEMRRIYRYGLLWAIGFPKPCGLVKQVRSPLPAPAVKPIRGHVPAERDGPIRCRQYLRRHKVHYERLTNLKRGVQSSFWAHRRSAGDGQKTAAPT